MDKETISGQRQYEFIKKFPYSREAGSREEEKAAKEIYQAVTTLGLIGRWEEFFFSYEEITEEGLIATEPFEVSYRVKAYRNCGNTPREGIAGPFLYVENGDDISLLQAKGCIVMINGQVRKEMYQKLVKAQVAGFISVAGTPIEEGEDENPAEYVLSEIEGPSVPGVSIHYKEGVKLIERGTRQVRLFVRGKKIERHSQNIAVRIEGKKEVEEIITLTAHYDSVPMGPGAYDNMAGAAIIMELAAYFSKNLPLRTLEFVWFGAEETGLCGSIAYSKQHKAQLWRHRFNMNVDLAGQLIGGNVLGVTAEPLVCQILSYILKEEGIGASLINNVWSSDSNTFAWKGIPAMTLNRDGFGMHTRHDTIAFISPDSLERSACLLGCVAKRLANAKMMPFERRVPDEFKKKLEPFFIFKERAVRI